MLSSKNRLKSFIKDGDLDNDFRHYDNSDASTDHFVKSFPMLPNPGLPINYLCTLQAMIAAERSYNFLESVEFSKREFSASSKETTMVSKNGEENDEDCEDKADKSDCDINSNKQAESFSMLSSWVFNAYAAMMLGRLSATNAAAENTNSNLDSGSESDPSSSSEAISRASSPDVSSQFPNFSTNYPINNGSRSTKKRKTAHSRTTNKDNNNHSNLDNETQRKKQSLNLQRVRYRYEREEYRCSLCPYACTIEKAYRRHLQAHAHGTATESRVSCAVCGADRPSEVDLSKHMRRHRDNRYFCCDICIFRTVQLKKLIQHRRMHTGEKPHLCPHCAYRSARRDNLRSHVRRVHKKENLYCDTFSPQGLFLQSPKSNVESNDEVSNLGNETVKLETSDESGLDSPDNKMSNEEDS